MIEYEILCQHIVDWREGRRPSTLPPPLGGGGAEPGYGEVQPEPEFEAVEPEPEFEAVEPEDPAAEVTYEDLAGAEAPELDATLEEAVPAASSAADEFAEGPSDRTQAYIPEDYDPADVAGQVAALDAQADAVLEEAAQMEPIDEEVELAPDEAPVDIEEEEEVAIDGDTEEGEEADDFASFNPYEDLGAFFRAENHITAVWDDDDQRLAALAQYGLRDEEHFYAVASSMERYFISDDAEQRYGGLDGIMALKEQSVASTAAEGEEPGEPSAPAAEPEGAPPITIEQWVEIDVAQAIGMEQGRNAADTLAQFGMTADDWVAAHGWWSQYYSLHAAENDGALQQHYAQLRAHYEAHYRGTAS